MESETSEYKKHIGGHVIRNEHTSNHEVLSSPSIMKYFEYVGLLKFCQKVEEFKYHDQLTSAFSTKLKRDKVAIVGFQITI